ncbi:hydroxymethylbilane synthase [Lewinellaceae bacterium SD302]|nr:hydroxymethylbilane synthase [Lewinellaceae bacterium SD302]
MLTIGTRGSKLALWQAHYVQDQLKAIGLEAQLEIIKTKGDRIQHLSFDKIEGKGFFTKEIEDALLEKRIDLAVHSLKDMPTTQPDGLTLAALSYREDPADLLIIRPEAVKEGATLSLADGATVGTSSARRKAQMLQLHPNVKLVDIRGNVPTRLDKARNGTVDAILLAAAGISRLEIDTGDLKVIRLHPREFVPAPGQGVMAIQTRLNDTDLRKQLSRIHNRETGVATNVERKVLQLLDGGCQTPLGVHCFQDKTGSYRAFAALAESWDAPVKTVHLSSSTHAGLAEEVVSKLGL